MSRPVVDLIMGFEDGSSVEMTFVHNPNIILSPEQDARDTLDIIQKEGLLGQRLKCYEIWERRCIEHT